MVPLHEIATKNKDLEGYIMFARVSTGQVMGDKVDELVMIFKESIIPTAKSQQGFRGAYLLIFPQNH